MKKSVIIASALSALLLSVGVQANDVQTLPSGVTVEHVVKGEGATPVASDTVSVHYRGTLEDGSEFDSSYSRNEPTSFPLQGVISCWTDGVQTMNVGGKANLTCPSDTAYGPNGIPGVIPGGATLNFEVELLSIN